MLNFPIPAVANPTRPAESSLGMFAGRLLVILVIAALAVALWKLTGILMLLFGATRRRERI